MIINGIRITISMNTLSNILSMKRKLEAKQARLICCHWITHISVEAGKGSIQNVLVPPLKKKVTSQTVWLIKLQIAIALRSNETVRQLPSPQPLFTLFKISWSFFQFLYFFYFFFLSILTHFFWLVNPSELFLCLITE